jgi:Mg2+-importing ATPase
MEKEKVKKIELNEVFNILKSSKEGLSSQESAIRLNEYGLNTFAKPDKKRLYKLILKQFKGSLVYLLIIAAVISFITNNISNGIIITVILLINAGLGFYQEDRSEKAIEKLEKLVSKETLVIRDQKQQSIPEKNLVIGDVVIIREGDIIPADMRLFDVDDLEVDESQLTGESVPVSKTTNGDNDLVFAGSTVVQGEGRGIVFATGFNTELGKIAHLSSSTTRITQYEKSLSSFSSFLVRVTFLTLLAIFILKLVITHGSTDISSLALFVIALSVAVVPEAMPVIVTVTLSRGALNLAKKHVITKTVTAVEDLGNINVLCSDKTGTLTQNKMTITKIVADDKKLFQILAMASLENLDEKRLKYQSSFDKAFISYIDQEIKNESLKYKRLKELPFDPIARRRRIISSDEKDTYLIEIGSLETLLNLTKPAKYNEYLNIDKNDGKKGLRHLAIAYKKINYTNDFDILKNENNLKFVGFCSMEDVLRPSAKNTIKLASSLGVSLKILSGDSREVTSYIANQVGLVEEDQKVYTGDEIENMSDIKLAEILKTNNAFARLNPEQKYRIIKILKLHGNVVGYQGDGINDAPSLKLADVSIAVNNATDVAKDSADIILLRNDIGVVINGIKFGREIFSNINKYIRFTFVSNWGNFFALSALYLLSVNNLPMFPIQVLLTSLLTDLPRITIATDNVDGGELTKPSRFNIHSLMFISIFLGTITAVFEIMYYAIIKQHSEAVASTGLYLFLTSTALIVIFTIRNRDHFWRAPKLSRPMKISFTILSLVAIALVYMPATKKLFHFSNFSIELFMIVVILTLVYFVIVDTVKVWFYRSTIGQRITEG